MKSFRHGALTVVILMLGTATSALADEREEHLYEAHLKWLKEEVTYIITEQEKDVFLSLETEEERNLLIDAFWERRDTDPATLENEFKTELYRSGLVGGKLSLTGIVGGRYRLRAQLVDASGGVVAERSRTITVSPRAEIPRAGLVYREGFRTEEAGLLPLARGQQLLVMGHVDEAIAELQESVDAANPRLPMAKWKLANALLFARQADRALEMLLPLEEQYADEYDVIEGLGLAYYLKDEHQTAIPYLGKVMGIRAPDIAVLNALGSCYRASGRNEEAKELFRRSLELKSDQPAVQEWFAEQEDSGSE